MRGSWRRGATGTLEILVVSGLLIFFIFAPVAYYNLTVSNMAIVSVFNTTLQAVSICGGYDERVEEQLYSNLLARGLIDSGGLSNIADIIADDKARPVGKRRVIVESNSNIGDEPIYRAHAAGDDSGITLEVSILMSNQRRFLAAISSLIGVRRDTSDGYFTLRGYIFSQLPKPI